MMLRSFLLPGAMVFAVLGDSAIAAPLVLDFIPPLVEARDICVAPAAGPGTLRVGEETDESALSDPDRIRFLRRDIRTHMREDAAQYFDFIEALIARQAELDATFTEVDVVFARIDLMLRADRQALIVAQGLVEDLRDRVDEMTNGQRLALARFYTDGVGVVADLAVAQQLIRDAAYGGNAEALLEIARLSQAGTLVEPWEAPIDLTVTMAFGGILGALDAGVCNRAERIAQEYIKGEVVRANPALALAWFRFAADLGSADAAWRVVEFYLNADGALSDNIALRHYLEQALRLGVAVDDQAARALVASGAVGETELPTLLGVNHNQSARRTRNAIAPLLQLDVNLPDEEVSKDGPYLVYLREIAQMSEAPGRVFDRLAQEVLMREGRWSGEAQALELLEEATKRGDAEGQRRLARHLVRYRDDAKVIARVDSLLADVSARFGDPRALQDLDRLYRCQVNDAPRLDRADAWARRFRASGYGAPQFSAADLVALSPNRDPEMIALIQSMALDRRSAMVSAHAQRVQANPSAAPGALRFWADEVNRSNQALEVFAELEFDLAQTPQARDVAVELLRRVALNNGVTTALEVGFKLVEYNGRDPEFVDVIVQQLTLSANRGEGAAIRLLARLQHKTRSEAEVFAQFADIIEERGDFLAMMFAIPHIAPERTDDYFDRAVSVMNCGTKDAAELADAHAILNEPALGFRWQNIGLTFEGGHVLSKLRLSDAQMARFGTGAAPDPVVRATRAMEQGDGGALLRLVALTSNPDLPSYDSAAAVEHILKAVQRSDLNGLGALVEFYRSAPQEVRTAVDRRIDVRALLLPVAEGGDAQAAFELGMLGRIQAQTSVDLATSLTWLEQAAAQGHRDALFEAGFALAFGLGRASDFDAALAWLDQAQNAGHPKAGELAQVLRVQKGP